MKIENISKKYNSNYIFENISFNFISHKVYAIFGNNGVGKTTLLNIMNGNLSYNEGHIASDDNVIFIETNDLPFDFMTADDFITTTFDFKKVKFDREYKKRLYGLLNFSPESKKIREFSKGMKSKLVLILALLSRPTVLLLDEPFVDIDIPSFGAITKLLLSMKDEITIIFSAHVADIAFELSDEILILDKNGIISFQNNFNNSLELKEYIESRKYLEKE